MNRKNAAGCVTKETRSGICSSKSLAEEKKKKIGRKTDNSESKKHKRKETVVMMINWAKCLVVVRLHGLGIVGVWKRIDLWLWE